MTFKSRKNSFVTADPTQRQQQQDVQRNFHFYEMNDFLNFYYLNMAFGTMH